MLKLKVRLGKDAIDLTSLHFMSENCKKYATSGI
jgi:hypothetical protein